MKKWIPILVISICFFLLNNKAEASHLTGGEITYSCTATAGVYQVTLTLYRDCSGISLGNCNGSCNSNCSYSLSVLGADATCNGTSFGNFSVSLVNVSDANPNPLCPNSKSICTNMGCVTAGSYTPGIEKYTFRGNVNLNTMSIPGSCCNVRIAFSECCRNSAINTGPAGASFYIETVFNRCITPCNSAPICSNDPFVIICASQPYIYNNGAIDPDLDSLSYSFTPALTAAGTSVTYSNPYSYLTPMPFTGTSASQTFPNGIHCDTLNGDVSFTPVYTGSGFFVGVVTIQILQWKKISNVPTLVGKTMRDVQMWLQQCAPNSTPTLITYPANGNQPIMNWTAIAGQQLCFDVVARDSNTTDTTYLTNNSGAAISGSTFIPNYVLTSRKISGPRQDSCKFCWTPDTTKINSVPYYFSVIGRDNKCPVGARTTRAFAITVVHDFNVNISQTFNGCYKVQLSYTQTGTPQTINSTIWTVSKIPNNYSMTNVDSFTTVTTPYISFSSGGKYLVKLNMTSNSGLSKTIYDTLRIDTPITIFVNDTSICKGSNATFNYFAQGGTSPYTYRWFTYPDTSVTVLNSNVNATTFLTSPNTTTKYILQARDSKGCRGYDSTINLMVRPLPVGLLPASMRICKGTSYTLDPGNNSGNIKKYLWNTGDSTRTILRSDSNLFIVTLTDTFGCKLSDSLSLFVNQQIFPFSGNDTMTCGVQAITLHATGGQNYQWKNLNTSTIVAAKSTNPNVSVTPSSTTNYEVTVFVTQGGLECPKTDTVKIIVDPNPPVSLLPASMRICFGTSYTLDPGNNNGNFVKYLWNTGDSSRTITRNDSNLFTVTLTDSFGCKLKDSLPLFKNQPITPFAGNDTLICGTQTIMLHATGGQNYQWKNLNTSTIVAAKSSNPNVSVSPSSTTNYEATVFVTQGGLECSKTDTVKIIVDPNPPVSLLPASMRICFGTSYTLDPGNNNGNFVKYLWNTGDSSRTITRNDSNLFTVTLTDSFGCKLKDSLPLFKNQPITPFAGNDTLICGTQTIMLHATGGQNYQWKNLNTSTIVASKSTNPNASVTPSSTTNYEVTVFVTQGGLECSKTDTVKIIVDPNPPVSLLPASMRICFGTSYTLDPGNNNGNFVKYLWSTGDSSRTITRNDSNLFIVTLTDSFGCKLKDSLPLFKNQPITPFAGNDTMYCGVQTIILHATGGQNYQWKNLSTNTVIATKSANPNVIVTPASTIMYEVTVYTTQGGLECSKTDTATLKVNLNPVNLLPASIRICSGSNTTLDPGNNSGNVKRYLWSTGDSTRTITRNDSNNFSVTITDTMNCTATASTMIYVNVPVTAHGGNDTSYCGVNTITLHASGGQNYQWKNINTNTIIATKSSNPNVNVTPASNTNYEVTVYILQSGMECSNRDTVSVRLEPNTPVSTLPASVRICFGSSFTFDPGNNNGRYAAYHWNTGDSTRTITRGDSNSFTVTLTDSFGCTSISSTSLYVNTQVPANAGNDTLNCGTQTITLHASGGQNYQWKNLNTNSIISTKSLNANTNVSSSTNTAYETTVYFTQGGVECSNKDTIKVIVDENPPVSYLPVTIRICNGSSYVLDPGNNSGIPVKYLWNTNDTTRTITRNDSNLFTVTLTDSFGCKLMDSLSLLINQPVIAFAGNDLMNCGTINTSLLASGGQNYEWKNLNTNSIISAKSSNANTIVSPSSTTSYEATVYAIQGGVECSNKDTIFVKVNTVPVSTLPASMRICYEGSYTLDPGNNSGNVKKYLWSTGDSTRTITRNDSNNFTVTITDTSGCKIISSIMLFVNPKISADAGTDTTFCGGGIVQLHASGGQNYQWKNLTSGSVISPKSVIADIGLMVSNTTSFEATVFSMNSGLECSTADTVTVNIIPNPATPVITGLATVPRGQANNFMVTNNPGSIYNWTVSNGIIKSGQGTNQVNVSFTTAGVNGILKALETASTNCKSDTGTKTITVTVGVGINNHSSFDNCKIYPNPSTGILNIELTTDEKQIQIEVMDVLGKVVIVSKHNHSSGEFKTAIDLRHLHSGIYFVNVKAGDKSVLSRITLE